ncbi:DMT family transporter [Alphaproteobacteria bacterium LSUCC0684]
MNGSLLHRAYSNAPLMLCLATLGWGGNTIASRLAVGEISPMALIFLRWAVVVVILLFTHGRQMKAAFPVIRARLPWIALMGGLGMTVFNALFYIAAHTTTAVNLGIIQSTMPGLILFGSFLVYGTRINSIQGIGLVIAFAGVVVIVTQGSLEQLFHLTFNSGDLLMLLACLFYSGYTIGLRNRPEIGGMVMMGYFAIAAWITTIPLMLIEGQITGILWPDLDGWLIILYVAIMPSFLSQVFFMRGVDLIGPGQAGLYTNLVPIYGAILAVIILGEALHLYHVAALGLVFFGIYLFEVRKTRVSN